jgi:hypothetical protein
VMVLLAPVRRTPTGWRKIGEKWLLITQSCGGWESRKWAQKCWGNRLVLFYLYQELKERMVGPQEHNNLGVLGSWHHTTSTHAAATINFEFGAGVQCDGGGWQIWWGHHDNTTLHTRTTSNVLYSFSDTHNHQDRTCKTALQLLHIRDLILVATKTKHTIPYFDLYVKESSSLHFLVSIHFASAASNVRQSNRCT